ncbi:MAG: helix-turn-helix transcriptional regulator [Clostridia bacterium]|nr:helix-turn-helix transcriptional regulator [Clostridia bacterium]
MLNEKIKELRKAKRVSQVEMASALGLTKQCVSNWENDNIQPSIEMLVKIADYFGVTTDYLLGRSETDVINVEGLSPVEISHIRDIVTDLRNR